MPLTDPEICPVICVVNREPPDPLLPLLAHPQTPGQSATLIGFAAFAHYLKRKAAGSAKVSIQVPFSCIGVRWKEEYPKIFIIYDFLQQELGLNLSGI